MPAAPTHRTLLVLGSIALGASTFAAFATLEIPGLGLGHLFYLPIALLALATGPTLGAAGGLVATALYAIAVLLNPRFPGRDLLDVSTGIRLVTYVSSGILIGWFAHSHRQLVARLTTAASSDHLTALLNVRAFEAALERRCVARSPFALVLADLDGLKALNDTRGHAHGNLVLQRFADALRSAARSGDALARVGGDEFALLTDAGLPEHAEAVCERLQAHVRERGVEASFGWAIHPADGGPSALFRRADERLYAAKQYGRAPGEVVDFVPLRRRVG